MDQIVFIKNLPSSVLVVRESEEIPCVRSINIKLGMIDATGGAG